MKRLLLSVLWLGSLVLAGAQVAEVKTLKDEQGWRLQVDGADFAVKGVVWSYTPVGENYTYDLWAQTDDYITRVIDTDMALIKAMGGNAIRVFSIVPPRWVEYIYDRYDIYTMVNDLFGRYGVTVDGRWQFPTDYSNPRTRATLLAQAEKTFQRFKDTRGVLMYMLGNESNYGLEWTSAAIENLPGGERNEYKAKALYSLFEEALALGKTIDPKRPMGLVNGDLQYLRVMKELVPSMDILGVNTYRGAQSYAAFYNSIAKDLNRPFVYTEMGADAYNVATEQEDQDSQARLLKSQWREIYDQAWGKGKAANALGAFVFEWMDEWWKGGMETGLLVHDTQGTWSNGGYTFDALPGRNNMNEEWFGIVGMSGHTVNGVARRLPRTAYYLLQDLWRLDLYTSTREAVAQKFAEVDFAAASIQGNLAQQRDETTDPRPAFVPRGSITMRSYLKGSDQGWKDTGTTSLTSASQVTSLVGFDLRTAEGLTGSFRFRFLPPHVANDPSNDLFDPAESSTKLGPGKTANATKPDQAIELYQATIDYRSEAFTATAHYHDGHADWVSEGDFFGLLPEAWDLANPDKDAAKSPFGVEVAFPTLVPGLKVYAGPELFWGAKPRVLAKYSRTFGPLSVHLMHDEELSAKASNTTKTNLTAHHWSSASLDLNLTNLGRLEAGGLLGRWNLVNSPDHRYSRFNGTKLLVDQKFTLLDAVGGKVRLSTDALPYLRASLQYLYAGVLADTREAIPREGSQLSDVGTGNRSEWQAMVQATYGDFVLRTTVLQRNPLMVPLNDAKAGGIVRNPLDDEFIVWSNREALQAEAVLTWDRTGATFFHDWNNVDREESPLSASLGLLYNLHLGATDGYLNYAEDGTMRAFTKGLPEVDGTWSLQAKANGRPFPGVRVALTGTAGRLQSTGEDPRVATFWRVGGQASVDRVIFEGSYAQDAWGPYGWHRTWNLTYPVQWTAGVAYGLRPVSFLSDTDRVGVRFSSRDYGPHSEVTTLKNRFQAELYAGWSF